MIVAHWMGEWGLFGFLAGLAVLTLIVIGLVSLVRSDGGGSAGRGSALRLIDERYARGEISRDEYLERRRVLTGGQPPADLP